LEVFADLLDRVQDLETYRPDRFGEMLLHDRLLVRFNGNVTHTGHVSPYFRLFGRSCWEFTHISSILYMYSSKLYFLLKEKTLPSQRKGFFRRHFRKEEEVDQKSHGKNPILQLGDQILTKNIVNVNDYSGIIKKTTSTCSVPLTYHFYSETGDKR